MLDEIDNCRAVVNDNQVDTDSDGIGDMCDTDDDADGVIDSADAAPLDPNIGLHSIWDSGVWQATEWYGEPSGSDLWDVSNWNEGQWRQ